MIPHDVRELLAEAERSDGTPPVSDQALLAASQGKRAILTVRGASDGSPRATPALAWVGPTVEGTTDISEPPLLAVGILGEGELDLVVRPAARGRGVGSRMLDELLEAQDRRAPGRELRAWAHGENPAAEALLGRAGFAPVRELYRLALDPARLPEATAAARRLPEGFTTRAFDPADPAEAEAWVRVNAAAFAEHPEQGAVTLQDFRALQDEAWFDPADLILAFDASAEDHLVGYTWVKTVREDEGTESELYVLGVDPAYAGRGLGAALLGETLRRMAEHRPDRITLYVDGDNENARALYDRAGFTVDQRSTQWLRTARH